tara:strand:+ start:1396 stop:1716 length:321 start_codon:yes stop_codon:yes gene_type:complete
VALAFFSTLKERLDSVDQEDHTIMDLTESEDFIACSSRTYIFDSFYCSLLPLAIACGNRPESWLEELLFCRHLSNGQYFGIQRLEFFLEIIGLFLFGMVIWGFRSG